MENKVSTQDQSPESYYWMVEEWLDVDNSN
jgi:hypothetical protein